MPLSCQKLKDICSTEENSVLQYTIHVTMKSEMEEFCPESIFFLSKLKSDEKIVRWLL